MLRVSTEIDAHAHSLNQLRNIAQILTVQIIGHTVDGTQPKDQTSLKQENFYSEAIDQIGRKDMAISPYPTSG